MAKKQTRRSISVSRTTYERLKSFCETQGISMSQFVENRVGDFLSSDSDGAGEQTPVAPRQTPPRPNPPRSGQGGEPRGDHRPVSSSTSSRQLAPVTQPPLRTAPAPAPTPMTSAAARYAVEPPLPIIKPRPDTVDVKPPVQPTADQIFTF